MYISYVYFLQKSASIFFALKVQRPSANESPPVQISLMFQLDILSFNWWRKVTF